MVSQKEYWDKPEYYREYHRKWVEKHPELHAAIQGRYNASGKGRENMRRYRQSYRGQETQRCYNESHREEKRKHFRRFYENHKDFMRKYRRVYEFYRLHGLPHPHYKKENWKDTKFPRRVARHANGRFITWEDGSCIR